MRGGWARALVADAPGAVPPGVWITGCAGRAGDWRVAVWKYEPRAREHAFWHSVLQAFSLVCWGLSLAVVMPYRLAFWYPSLAIDIALSFFMSQRYRVRPRGAARTDPWPNHLASLYLRKGPDARHWARRGTGGLSPTLCRCRSPDRTCRSASACSPSLCWASW